MRRAILHNEKGSALLISLLLMGMLTLLAVMAVRSSNTDMDLTFNQINGDKTFYIAEAGAKRAIAELNIDPSWTAGYSNIGFNGGSYTVQITDSSTNAALIDTIIITSTGWTINAQSAVEMAVVPRYNNPFKHALFGDDGVELKNGMRTDSYNSDSGSYAATRDTLDGDVGSNATITMHNGSYVGGDVVTSSDSSALDINGGATVTGDVKYDVPEETLDPIPQAEFDMAESNNDNTTGISGSYSYNPSTYAFQSSGTVTLSDGTYYFSSIILKNSAELIIAPGAEVKIYVTGDIEIKNSGGVNVGGTPGDLMFLSQGDIVLKNSGELSAIFYSPDGDGDLRNSADFYGSIVAKTIVVHNSAAFHYDRELGKKRISSIIGYEAVAWREL
ncbi:MAG: hypothetical protein CVT49_05660 [candidate division Zixibacteria bacterium HGW-Zixibacteria-1]|nr:MAG: hypothetical protein CVT49_05660 [candidate division Zixibacteria bacterium HGW-Zixibacteria-1]